MCLSKKSKNGNFYQLKKPNVGKFVNLQVERFFSNFRNSQVFFSFVKHDSNTPRHSKFAKFSALLLISLLADGQKGFQTTPT